MDSLNPDNNVPRQATFETEPADTVRGRNIKRGDINIPYIDDKSVINSTQEIPKDTEALKKELRKEQLKALKEKQLKGKDFQTKKDKELKDLKDKQDRELREEKEKLLKINNEREVIAKKERELKALKDKEQKAQKERELKSKKEKELKEQKEREMKANKEKELKALKEREIKAQKEKELKTQKEKELKVQKEKERNAQKEKELKAQKEKELKAQKEKELKAQKEKEEKDKKDKELKMQKDKELKAKKERELKSQHEREAKAQKEREINAQLNHDIKLQKERDLKALREKESKLLKAKQLSSNDHVKRAQNVEERKRLMAEQEWKEAEQEKQSADNDENKPGFFKRLGRSLSPSKKDKSYPNKDPSVPDILVVDDDRFAEVRVPTPAKSIHEDNSKEKQHFKAAPPLRVDDDTPRFGNETSRDSLILSHENESPAPEKPSEMVPRTGAWTTEEEDSSNLNQKSKILRKVNTNSPTRLSQPDDDVQESVRSRKAKYLRSSPVKSNQNSNSESSSLPKKSVADSTYVQDDTLSLSSNRSETQEQYQQVLLERDSLLDAEITYMKRIRQLEDETAQLTGVIEELEIEKRELMWNIENPSSVNEIALLTKKLQDQIESLEKEIEDLKKESKKYKILHHDSERKITEIEQENDILKDKMILYEQDKLPQIEQLQLENKKLEASMKLLKIKSKETDEHFDILKNENKELSDELRTRRNEVQELLENLKNQKTTELELQKANNRLEERLKKFESQEQELANYVAQAAITEAEKEQMQSLVKDKEKELKEVQDLVDKKENEIENQKLAVELQKEEIDTLKDDIEKQKKESEKIVSLEKEIASLKNTLKLLQNELDESHKENKALKMDIEGGKKKIVRIQEHVQEAAETNEKLRKTEGTLEAEKKAKLNLEEKLTLSKDEVSKLQQQNMELSIKVGNMNERLKFLEQVNQDNFNTARETKREVDVDEKLASENRRLRFRLVEHNFTEIEDKNAKKALSSRLENLEQKQVDNEVKVKQLQGWVDDIYSESPSRTSPAALTASYPPTQAAPRVAAAVQSDKTHNRTSKSKKTKDISPRPPKGKKPNAGVTVSLDTKDTSRSSTPTLPIIQDIPEQASVYNSYFYIYKQKQKLMRQQQKIR
ncbi:trichohyalin [Patella vulgata]|uniref:trichohyalin n=1 Tax=Patella vulgata TaxID=6465 RepID=UPI0024A838A4|nr:trichohyalin [Patella vulgata]